MFYNLIINFINWFICMIKYFNTDPKNGFSLIELAIVLIVIAIIVMGIVQGSNLINNSKMTYISTQLNEYGVAIEQFYNIYGELPGDFTKAKETFCTDDSDCTENGDGDGFIGSGQNSSDIGVEPESMNAFQHLYLAGLSPFNMKFLGNIGYKATGKIDETIYPKLRSIKNAFIFIESGDIGSRYNRNNRVAFGILDGEGKLNTILDVKTMYMYDIKTDDGKPLTGKVVTEAPGDIGE